MKLWYRAEANPTSWMSVNGTMLPDGVGWTEATACLDPDRAGRPQGVDVQIYGGSGSCSAIPAERRWIDDVLLTTDPACAPD